MSEEKINKREEQAPGTVERAKNRKVFKPAVDILKDGENILLLADMPGVDNEHVSVSVENNILTVRGTTEDIDTKARKLVYREFRHGDFERSFEIAADIEVEKIDAEIKDGRLKVILPKCERMKAKKINVRKTD